MISRHEAVVRLRGAHWVHDRDFLQIFEILDGRDDRTRAVGGIVRDTIIGKADMRTDVDMASELVPEEVMKRALEAGMSCYPTGIEHGTVTIRHGQVTAEVTTLRQDINTDGRRATVRFGSNWRADAQRRDFTINALYASMNGALYDPLDGLEDLFYHRVRFIGDPDQRIREDRLRVLRFFRFSASHGEEICDPAGLAACGRFAAELGLLSAERVGSEMLKILALQRVAATLALMTKVGVLDLGVHTLEVLARYEDLTSSPVALARLAILMAGSQPKKLQEKWRLSNVAVREALEIGEAAKLIQKKEFNQAAYRYARLGSVALPVAAGMGRWDTQRLHEAMEKFHQIHVPGFPLNGHDLVEAGFKSGPQLGDALRRIEGEWVNSGFKMERKELLEHLKTYLAV